MTTIQTQMTTTSQTKSFLAMSDVAGPRLVHIPALDGLRGVAVLLVVLYHAGFSWMTGGYLGVSTFFTLSGFLITSVLMNESRREGRPSLRRFWVRRFRRLMPAALGTLALVSLLFARTIATGDQRLDMRGDVLSSLFYVANWRFIVDGSTYGDFTAGPSPVLHFWSLSIEEQFYVIFPLLVWGLWRISRRRRAWLAGTLAALAVVSGVLPAVLDMGVNRAYLGSDTRAVEILAGGLLAVAVSSRKVRTLFALKYWPRLMLFAAALACALVQIYWAVSVPQSSPWLYRGGLTSYALMTCVVILAAVMPTGPFRAALSLSPLRWLGTRSYGIYLYHWPLLLAARQLRPSWWRPGSALLAVGVALTLAELSFRFLEQPIRRGGWPVGRHALRTAAVSVLAVALLAAIPLPVDRSEAPIDFENALKDFRSAESIRPTTPASESDATATTPLESSPETTSLATTTTTVPVPPPVIDVATFGDSTALLVSRGLGKSIQDGGTTKLANVGGYVELGCGVSRFASIRLLDEAPPMEKCGRLPFLWGEATQRTQPDVAQLITGAWEVVDAKIPGSDRWSSIGDPEVDKFIKAELMAAVDTLSSTGALVVIYLWPTYAEWADDGGRPPVARQHDPMRMTRLHQIISEIAAERPDVVRTLDLGEFLGPDRLADRTLRVDGLHISGERMAELYSTGLGDRIYVIYSEWFSHQSG